jgi:hypothetical protein
MYDPIRVPVIRRGDAVTAELTRDAAMQGLSLSEDALTGVEQALAPAAPRDAAPGIVKMEFLVDDQTCERSLQRRTGTLLSPADAGCRRWPAEVAFTVVLSPQTAVPDDVYQAVTLAPVSLRTGGLDQLENPPYHRSIVIDAQAMMEPLGGAAAHISRKAPGWSIALYGTEYCDEPKGAIGPEGEQQDNERQPLDLTWPVYARVNWWEDPYGSPVPMSDCVPITIDGLRKQDGKLDGHFAFDLKRLPDGRGVLVLSISTDVNGGGRRQVLQTALERFGARYADLAAGGDRSMNELELWDMTSTGTVRERARLSQVGDNAAEIRRLFAEEIERGGAPSVPDLGLIEQIVRVSEADAGAVIIIEGRGYDADIERLFARISASSTPLAPDRFWLFLLEGCERWTEFARDEIKQNCTEMQSLTTAELQSRLDTVLLSFLPGE